MDKEIQIDLTNLALVIQGLERTKNSMEQSIKKLIETSSNIPVEDSSKTGSGEALKVLESIKEEYDKMKEAAITLLDKTTEYMNDVNKSFEGQDKALADHMKLGG